MRCYCDLWSSPLCPGPGLCSPRVVLRLTRLKATPRHLWSEQRRCALQFLTFSLQYFRRGAVLDTVLILSNLLSLFLSLRMQETGGKSRNKLIIEGKLNKYRVANLQIIAINLNVFNSRSNFLIFF